MNVDSFKSMHFRVYEFEVGVNDSIFPGNKQQKVQYSRMPMQFTYLVPISFADSVSHTSTDCNTYFHKKGHSTLSK